MAAIAAVLSAAYLLGSIPTAVIVARRVAGVDIRALGDGNTGARNVSRTLGTRPAIVVALVDFFKGALAVQLAQQAGLAPQWRVAAAFAAALGHDFHSSPGSWRRGWAPRWAAAGPLAGPGGAGLLLYGLAFVLAPLRLSAAARSCWG
jgi:glycerol-3-phosphate acyltransferase PlsY